jgi:hypothetical protein
MREKRLKKLNKAKQERVTQKIDDQEKPTAEQTNEEV